MSDIFKAKRGSTLNVSMTVLKDGVAASLVGCTGFSCMAKRHHGQPDSLAVFTVTQTENTHGQIEVQDAATGLLSVIIKPEHTATLQPGQYFLAIQFSHPTEGVVEIPSDETGYTFTVIADIIQA